MIQAIRGNQNSHYKLWQTPVADDAVNRINGKINSRGEPKLSAQVKMWPTPTVCGNNNRKGVSATSGDGLATAVRLMGVPTPCQSDYKIASKDGQRRGQIGDPAQGVIPRGGSLNPAWVEWLMGWPLNWTRIGGVSNRTSEESQLESKTGLVNSKPSATGKSRSRRRSPGQC